MDGYVTNIERDTLENEDYRRVLYTGPHTQLVLMTLRPGEEIGLEAHEGHDQFIRVEEGTGYVQLNGERHELGLVGAALQAFDAGVPVLYLGTELPAIEIARIAGRVPVAGIALGSTDAQQARHALEALRELDAGLAPGVPVWLGGANARYLAEELRSPRIRAVGDALALVRGATARVRRG